MSFQIAGLCFSSASGMTFHHNLGFVVLSYVIASGGSYTALEMIERWRHGQDASARYWQFASAAVLGGSIWSMHFIAMLALEIDLPITYAPGPTLVSLLIEVSIAAGGLQIVRANPSWAHVGGAGAVVGMGIAAMHYVGMSSMRFPGSLAYHPGLWSMSIMVAVAAATAALWLSFRVHVLWQRIVAALVMGGGICGVHYVGMASTVFRLDPLAQVTPGLVRSPIAFAVALTTLTFTLCALVLVVANRRSQAASRQEAEVLREANAHLILANAELAQLNARFEIGRQQLNSVLDNMIQGVTFFDVNQELIICNRRYREIYGLSLQQTRTGTPLSEILRDRIIVGTHPNMTPSEFLARRGSLSRAGRPYDVVEDLQDGRVISMRYQPLLDGGWVTTHEDITEQRQAEARLVFMAGHDALTQLPNRELFRERLEQAIAVAGSGHVCAALCLDMDNFKRVNDTLGHPVGDGLLKAAGDRLKSCVREADTVARLGGDEFAVIQPAIPGPADAEGLAKRIIAAFSKPFDVKGHQILIGTSIGVALAPADGTTSEQLLKHADIALYLSKAEGRGTVRFFEAEMDLRIQERQTLERDLRDAFAHEEFELYYQPLINVIAGSVSGFEALLRWHHPIRGLVSPTEFISVAEDTGMIVAIGEWVLRMACFEAQKWPIDIRVAVNLSPVQFRKGGIVATVQAALTASGLPPHRLELEITETVLLHHTVGTLTALHELRAMGIAIALDDFGTGYSSLSYLRSFPFDKIKIDQSFVRDLVSNKESMSIIRAVTGLGHSLSLRTTAEGVETQEQLDRLRLEGCTEVQGYLFSPPRPAIELPALIERLCRHPWGPQHSLTR
jgi:diguanylate cyclase (GGDEF)-like protein